MTAERRYWIWTFVVLVVGVALRSPSLAAGFGMDDFAQLAMLEGAYPVPRHPWDLFSFSKGDPAEVATLMDHGSLAWWSHPALRLSALRPLSSLLMWLDVQLFRHAAVWHHVHTLLWWSAMLLSAAALLRRVLPLRWAALTLLLYALDECHTYPIGWLANRNAIVSATFGFLGLWAHVRWREDGWARGRWLAPLAVLLSLAGGEYALCIVPFFVLYELIAAPEAGPLRDTWKPRLRALLPLLGLLIAYVALHRGLGLGAYASNVYVDPVREPLAYLSTASLRIPVLVADMFLAIPTGKIAFQPTLLELQAYFGPAAVLVLLVVLPGLLRRLDPRLRRRALWLLAAAVLAILPVASSFVSARLLLIPAVGGHAVVAAVLLDGWDGLRDRARRWRPVTLLRALLAAVLALAHFGLATYFGLQETLNIVQLNEGTRLSSLQMQVDDRMVPQQRLVVLTAGDPMTLLYPPTVRWVEGHPMPRAWWVLSMAPHNHVMTRVSANALELEVIGGAMLEGPVERLFRRSEFPFRPGDVVRLEGMTIELLQVDAQGRPVKIRCTFDTSLDDPSLVFLLTTKRGMIRYPMGRAGARMVIPAAQLPMVLDVEATQARAPAAAGPG